MHLSSPILYHLQAVTFNSRTTFLLVTISIKLGTFTLTTATRCWTRYVSLRKISGESATTNLTLESWNRTTNQERSRFTLSHLSPWSLRSITSSHPSSVQLSLFSRFTPTSAVSQFSHVLATRCLASSHRNTFSSMPRKQKRKEATRRRKYYRSNRG